jgi:quercetin dioxygenase-like cupin family protein
MTIASQYSRLLAICGPICASLIGPVTAQEPPKESKGQTAAEHCTIDRSAGIASPKGRRLRMRLITLEPGGIVAVHGHEDRPTLMHVTSGTLPSHWGGPDRTLRPGDCVAEGKDITQHWMENTGNGQATYISVDVTK